MTSLPQPTTRSPLDMPAGQTLGRHTRSVFGCWMIVFALVGAQMGWVLRPFIGSSALAVHCVPRAEIEFLRSGAERVGRPVLRRRLSDARLPYWRRRCAAAGAVGHAAARLATCHPAAGGVPRFVRTAVWRGDGQLSRPGRAAAMGPADGVLGHQSAAIADGHVCDQLAQLLRP